MKIILFGASGKTGLELTRQALERQHEVTAFIRPTSTFALQHERLQRATGQLDDVPALVNSIQGQDVVVSALGAAHPFTYDPVVVIGMGNILQAMKSAGVHRLIYLSPLAVKENRGEAGFFLHYIAPVLLRTEIRGHEDREALIKKSGLNWTLVRAPFLTLGPHTGQFKMGPDLQFHGFLPKLSRADVADAMLQQLASNDPPCTKIRVLPD